MLVLFVGATKEAGRRIGFRFICVVIFNKSPPGNISSFRSKIQCHVFCIMWHTIACTAFHSYSLPTSLKNFSVLLHWCDLILGKYENNTAVPHCMVIGFAHPSHIHLEIELHVPFYRRHFVSSPKPHAYHTSNRTNIFLQVSQLRKHSFFYERPWT